MSQATELLNSLTDEQIAVYSAGSGKTEEHIVIGNDRFITVPMSLRRLAVQYDHNVETVTFDCPRYWDGLDMSKMAIYINFMLPNKMLGASLAENVSIDSADSNIMHFTWTIKSDVTKVAGTISFLVCIKKTDSEGIEENHWNSELNTECYISKGMETVESVVSEHPDIITQLLLRMDAVEAVQDIAVNAAAEAKAKAEEASGYSDEAAALLEDTKGYAKTAQDAAADTLNIHGRIDRNDKRLTILEQGLSDYVPSVTDSGMEHVKDIPANALPYTRINEIGGMTRKCTNLIKTITTNTLSGVTATVSDDGTVTMSGTTAGSYLYFIFNNTLSAGTYYMNWNEVNIVGVSLLVYNFDESKVLLYNSGKITLTTDAKVGIYLNASNAGIAVSGTIKPMLNKGETALPYEPYFTGLRDAKVTAMESVGACLMSAYTAYNGVNGYAEMVVDGRNCIRMNSGVSFKTAPIAFKENTQYTVSFETKAVDNGASTGNCVFAFFYTDGTRTQLNSSKNQPTFTQMTLTSEAGKTVKEIGVYVVQYLVYNYIDIDSFRFVEGTEVPVDCKPYFKRTFPIPEAVQALDGYGQGISKEYHNKLVLDPASGVKKFVAATNRVVFNGTENWTASDYGDVYVDANAKLANDSVMVICDRYDGASFNDRINFTSAIVYIAPISATRNGIFFRYTGYSTVDEWKAYLAEQYAAGTPLTVEYALVETTETDVSAYFTDDNLIGVEAGGTVTAVNEYDYDVPTSLTHWLKKTNA